MKRNYSDKYNVLGKTCSHPKVIVFPGITYTDYAFITQNTVYKSDTGEIMERKYRSNKTK